MDEASVAVVITRFSFSHCSIHADEVPTYDNGKTAFYWEAGELQDVSTTPVWALFRNTVTREKAAATLSAEGWLNNIPRI